MTYADLIAHAMSRRGKMTTQEIYAQVSQWAFLRREKLTRHWRGTVRNTLQRHSKSSPKFVKPNLFIHHDRGIWELRNARSRRSR